MRIATWNVESLRKLTPEREVAFHQAMAGVDADVWVLTETWTTFSPGSHYRLVARSQEAADLIRWPDRCWVTIWAKSSLVATPQTVRSQADRMSCGRIEMPGTKDIVVVGTVLPWGSDELWPGEDGFSESLALQAAEWGSLCGGLHRCKFVVAGDFNQSIPHERWYGSEKSEAALSGALEVYDLMCLTQGKCPLTNTPRIDHICISRYGLDPNHLPQVGDWAIPSVGSRPATADRRRIIQAPTSIWWRRVSHENLHPLQSAAKKDGV